MRIPFVRTKRFAVRCIDTNLWLLFGTRDGIRPFTSDCSLDVQNFIAGRLRGGCEFFETAIMSDAELAALPQSGARVVRAEEMLPCP